MKLRTKELDDVKIVILDGRLDVTRSFELENEMTRLIQEGANKIVVDLKDLEFLSSSGLRVFIMVMKQLGEKQGKFILCRIPPEVRKILKIVELEDLFEICAEMGEALTSCRMAMTES